MSVSGEARKLVTLDQLLEEQQNQRERLYNFGSRLMAIRRSLSGGVDSIKEAAAETEEVSSFVDKAVFNNGVIRAMMDHIENQINGIESVVGSRDLPTCEKMPEKASRIR